MKNKALTYLLLIVVAVVWYQVFLRIRSNVAANDEGNLTAARQHTGFIPVQKDTFLLNADYRDPFTGKAKTGQKEMLPEIPAVKEPVKPQFIWPKVSYYGWVRKTDSKDPLCIVNIDGMLLYLRKGDEVFDGIRVTMVDRDFIRLKKGKHQQYFYRK